MNNIFFSRENIERLTNSLAKNLNIKNSPESRKACRKFVETQMKSIYEKYSDKRPSEMPIPEFLSKLNTKIIDDCIKLYEAKTGKRTHHNTGHNNFINMQRDREIYGNRQPITESRPQHTSGINNVGLPGMLDTSIGGNWASVSNLAGPGEYIQATGEMGMRMQIGGGNNGFGDNNDNNNFNIDKKGSIDDLERRMMERQNDYQARPMNMNAYGGFGGAGGGYYDGFNGNNANGFGNNTMYNPNVFGQNQKPPEINFALDGSDTRRTREREELIRQATGGQQQNNEMMGNFTGFDGNMGGSMGFDMMGMGLMGNNMGNQMMGNQMMGNQIMGNQMMGNQMMGNQMMGNQMMGNQMMGNQMMGNQMMGNQMMGNQMMGNNMGNQMMGNNMGNSYDPHNLSDSKISETDLKKKLSDMMHDRGSISIQKTGNFNPMQSPSLQNMNQGGQHNIQQMLQYQQSLNNNINFPKGGMVGISNISATKSAVASSYGIDLKQIQSMSSQDIEKIINKVKNNVMIGASEIANKGTENIEDSDKRKLLNLIKKAKKINKKKEVSSGEENSETSEEIKPKKSVKFTDKPKLKRAKLVSINAAEHTEPEYFNDYMVDLPENIKNISGIEILDYSFPKELFTINENNNQLIIIINQEEKIIELESGNYSIDEIIDGLQSAFDADDIAINIDIDTEEHIILSSPKLEFAFKNDDNSMMQILGFKEKFYNNERVYRSETKHMLVSKIYFYIDNISNNEPFGVIDLKSRNNSTLIKKFNKPINEIKEMILKFKRRPTQDDDLIDFLNKPHKLTFKFETN